LARLRPQPPVVVEFGAGHGERGGHTELTIAVRCRVTERSGEPLHVTGFDGKALRNHRTSEVI
jgi:hypothetical protein